MNSLLGTQRKKKEATLADAERKIADYTYEKYTGSNEYKNLQKQYSKAGQLAKENTLGKQASKTGGIASSYAVTASQKAEDDYASGFEKAAREKYNQNLTALKNEREHLYTKDKEQKEAVLNFALKQMEYSQAEKEKTTAAADKPISAGETTNSAGEKTTTPAGEKSNAPAGVKPTAPATPAEPITPQEPAPAPAAQYAETENQRTEYEMERDVIFSEDLTEVEKPQENTEGTEKQDDLEEETPQVPERETPGEESEETNQTPSEFSAGNNPFKEMQFSSAYVAEVAKNLNFVMPPIFFEKASEMESRIVKLSTRIETYNQELNAAYEKYLRLNEEVEARENSFRDANALSEKYGGDYMRGYQIEKVQYEEAKEAAKKAYDDYAGIQSRIWDLVEAANEYMTYISEETERQSRWAQTVRTDQNAIETEILSLQNELSRFGDKLTYYSTEAYSEAIRKALLQIVNKKGEGVSFTEEYFNYGEWDANSRKETEKILSALADDREVLNKLQKSGLTPELVEEIRKKHVKELEEEIANMQKLLGYLDAELYCSINNSYNRLRSNADFAENSQAVIPDYIKDNLTGIDLLLSDEYAEGDTKYLYINEIGNIREAVNENKDILSEFGIYDTMTDEEKQMYNYLYATQGKDKAEEYLDFLNLQTVYYLDENGNLQATSEGLKVRQGQTLYEQWGGNFLGNTYLAMGAGLKNFEQGIATVLTGEQQEESAQQFAAAMARSEAGPIGKFLMDAAQTIAGMAPSILVRIAISFVNPALGAFVSAAMSSVSEAGNAYDEALDRGLDKDQAKAYAAFTGVAEGAMQYVLGKIFNAGKGISGKNVTKAISRMEEIINKGAAIGIKALSEGAEEALQTLIEPAIYSMISNEKYSVEWEDVLYSFFVAAASSAPYEAADVLVDEKKIRAGIVKELADGVEKSGNIKAAKAIVATLGNKPEVSAAEILNAVKKVLPGQDVKVQSDSKNNIANQTTLFESIDTRIESKYSENGYKGIEQETDFKRGSAYIEVSSSEINADNALYHYINDPKNEIAAGYVKKTAIDEDLLMLDKLTPEEKMRYNYIKIQEGDAQAQLYLKTLESELRNRAGIE